jgi:hypothetical protein
MDGGIPLAMQFWCGFFMALGAGNVLLLVSQLRMSLLCFSRSDKARYNRGTQQGRQAALYTQDILLHVCPPLMGCGCIS